MSTSDDPNITVTGEERAHPSIRLLARACIDLARQQLTAEQAAPESTTCDPGPTDGVASPAIEPEADRHV